MGRPTRFFVVMDTRDWRNGSCWADAGRLWDMYKNLADLAIIAWAGGIKGTTWTLDREPFPPATFNTPFAQYTRKLFHWSCETVSIWTLATHVLAFELPLCHRG
jgi:hypothetical protein